jgi:hypothetical protein
MFQAAFGRGPRSGRGADHGPDFAAEFAIKSQFDSFSIRCVSNSEMIPPAAIPPAVGERSPPPRGRGCPLPPTPPPPCWTKPLMYMYYSYGTQKYGIPKKFILANRHESNSRLQSERCSRHIPQVALCSVRRLVPKNLGAVYFKILQVTILPKQSPSENSEGSTLMHPFQFWKGPAAVGSPRFL